MTTSDSALNALAHAVRAADSPLAAGLAEILTDAIQELIEAELTARIGAELPHGPHRKEHSGGIGTTDGQTKACRDTHGTPEDRYQAMISQLEQEAVGLMAISPLAASEHTGRSKGPREGLN